MISYKDIFKAVIEDVRDARDARDVWVLMGAKTLFNIKKQRWNILYKRSLVRETGWITR